MLKDENEAEEELHRMQADFCKAMGHPRRIHILRDLKGGEKTVTELARMTGLPQANVSQHLGILRQFGLLSTRRAGSNVYYAISDHRIVEACELVRACIGSRLKKSQLVLAVAPE